MLVGGARGTTSHRLLQPDKVYEEKKEKTKSIYEEPFERMYV